MADSDGTADRVAMDLAVAGRVEEPGRLAELYGIAVAGRDCCAESSKAVANAANPVYGEMFARRLAASGGCDAAVGVREDSEVSGVRSSPPKLSSALEIRLVTLSQLTGRTRVLACSRGAGVVAPSGPAGPCCGSLGEKAALSLLNKVPTFLSPARDWVKERLLI